MNTLNKKQLSFEKTDADEFIITGSSYKLLIRKKSEAELFTASDEKVMSFPLAIAVNSLFERERVSELQLNELNETEEVISFSFSGKSSVWTEKKYTLKCFKDYVELFCNVSGRSRRIDSIAYFSGVTKKAEASFEKYYSPRFDWSKGKVFHFPTASDSLSCQQWLSPPPFCYSFNTGENWTGCAVAALPGKNNFLSFDYKAEASGFSLDLQYEGHTLVEERFETPHLIISSGHTEENDSVRTCIEIFRDMEFLPRVDAKKEIPSWWREPIFCGWGQQRLDYRIDHDNGENSWWANCGDYSTENFYRKYLALLLEKDIKPGIVIIDCFWAKHTAYAEPNSLYWKDMRAFIDECHAKDIHVLLWFTPLVAEGLPDEACMLLENKVVAPDPTSPELKRILADQIRIMLSSEEGCLNADGFKIDFTQNVPSESGVMRNYLHNKWGIISEEVGKIYPPLSERNCLIQMHDECWGAELIRRYLENIHTTMKKVKSDSVLITHTSNPYYADIVDVLRLNDLDGTSPDVLGIMKNRAEIAKMSNPNWLIDTDNDLMIHKDMWRSYMKIQSQLGIPDTYYATGIAQSGEMFDEDDYALLREVFEEYRKSLGT